MAPEREEDESATLVTAEQPKSSCSTYLAEGDKLYRKGELKKAIDSYSAVTTLPLTLNLFSILKCFRWLQALERAEAEGIDKRPCFYSRALCQLLLGNSEAALEDAEESLEDDPNYSKVTTHSLFLLIWENGKKLPNCDKFSLFSASFLTKTLAFIVNPWLRSLLNL